MIALHYFTTLALGVNALASWPPQAPTNATCNVEGSIKPTYGHYGLGVDFDNAYECWELCTDGRRPPRCQSFSWESTAKKCKLFDVSVEDGVDEGDSTGALYYNRDCFVYTLRPGVNNKN
ncbi:hypothetical protein BDP55DRAFT_675159 [Colletotrichum godetiae]|uniref:Apple domain-containing protein n=1 Tax=Colletotrichum godetiae TaxID=1209918 RepID=A0AAJ0AH91_9PEZI|nr:uncharacterized protein BDP55DRAFT_675159 [Colletotrichum godetiae]KAK1671686.1 hypothetical protein BDP55DRAFT_675159 [Colletotrichum godetiae]